MDQGNWESQI
nr:unnamed protein product [Callosobruchus analis]